MTLSTFSLTHTLSSPPSLWKGAQQLVVVVTPAYEQRGYLLAYGIDPASVNPPVDKPVFECMLPSNGLSAFLSFLIDGDPNKLSPPATVLEDPVLSELEHRGGVIIANAVDVTNSNPQPPGPKLTVVFALARSISSDESLAAVAAYAA